MSAHPEAHAADLRKPIDKDLPHPTRSSLTQWCRIWDRLKRSGQLQQRDQFALTGHYLDPDSQLPTRSRIDFNDHRIPDNVIPTQHCDIDSVIGIVKDHFPIAPGVKIKYFMLLSPSHTLSTDLHLPPVIVADEHGPDMSVDPHRTHNARMFEMEPQTLVRIAFPRLDHAVGNAELRLLYDLAVRPAAVEQLPRELTGTWLATFDDELFRAETLSRAAGEGRRVQHSGRDIHSAYLNDFIRRMRQFVDTKEELQWARSFFFIVEMRGLKTRDGSMHVPPEVCPVDADGNVQEESPRVRAVNRILGGFNSAEFEPDHWFIDLGMNFMIPDRLGGFACPLPAVEAHAAILSHVLDVDIETCSDWVNGTGNHYQRDELAQLKDVGGFCFTNPNCQRDGIAYIQLYTSDKSLTYNLNLPSNAKRITTWQTLRNWDQARKNHFQPLVKSFQDASSAHEMYLRLEVRAEFGQYPFVQLRVSDEQARVWMFQVGPRDFWGWKTYRLESIYSVLRKWMERRDSFVIDDLPEAGSLLVSLVWMANALVNRPDEGGTWNQIRDASSIHAMHDGEFVPVWPLRAHFLHSLRFEEKRQPRTSSQRSILINVILYVCSSKNPPITESELHAMVVDGKAEESDLLPDALEEGPGQTQPVYAMAMANKQRSVKTRARVRQADMFAEVLPEPEHRVRFASEEGDYEERQRPTTRSQALTDIIADLPLQIFVKCPSQKATGRSWSAFPSGSPMIRSDIFCCRADLERVFPSHICFGTDSDKWNAAVNVLLPTVAESKKLLQGAHCLSARDRFIELQRTLSAEDRKNLVEQARQHVHQRWAWLPYGSGKGHLWSTGVSNVPRYAVHVGGLPGGPWIILNPARV